MAGPGGRGPGAGGRGPGAGGRGPGDGAGPIARALRISTAVAGALAASLGAGILALFLPAAAPFSLDGAALIGAVALAGGAVTVPLAMRRRVPAALVVLASGFVVINWVFVLRVLPSFEAYKPVPALAEVLRSRAAHDDIVATYNEALPSLVYYLRRHVDVSYEPEPIVRFLESDRTAYVILSREDYNEIAAATRSPTCIVTSQPTFDVKLRNVLAGEPPPDLLLITNRCGSTSRPG